MKIRLPLPPSANHAYARNPYTGQRVLKREGKKYINDVTLLVRQTVREPYPQLMKLELEFHWPNKRVRDDDNAQKLLMDGLKGSLVEDDNWARLPLKIIRNMFDAGDAHVLIDFIPPH